MKTLDIEASGNLYSLRLTTAKLQGYLAAVKADNQAPLLGVLDALSNLDKRIKLFTAALSWQGNHNPRQTGAAFLDDLADDDEAPPVEDLILALAMDCGLIRGEDLDGLSDAVKSGNRNLVDTLCTLLRGEDIPQAAAAPAADNSENPTAQAPSDG